MAETWTVVSTTRGPMFTSGAAMRSVIPASGYPVGTIARTCESTGMCYAYTCERITLGGPAVGIAQAWVRTGLTTLAFVAGAAEFQPGATVLV